jgi:hypothetical protein
MGNVSISCPNMGILNCDPSGNCDQHSPLILTVGVEQSSLCTAESKQIMSAKNPGYLPVLLDLNITLREPIHKKTV